MMPAEAGSAGSRSEPASRAVSLYRDKHLELVDYPVRVLFRDGQDCWHDGPVMRDPDI